MYDALVIGTGAMGSATLYHLAQRGLRVIGIDAHDPPHTLGSTHGRSRIIREAYYEDPVYVPLVRHAYANWDSLAREARVDLFTPTGAMMIGAPGSELIEGTIASTREHSIPVEILDAPGIRSRFPLLAPSDWMVGVLEKNAGVLDPELCVSSHLTLARRHGAELRTHVSARSLELLSDGVRTHLEDGVIDARKIVLSAGAWASRLLETIGVHAPLTVERQTMHWFESAEPAGPEQLPVVMIENERGTLFYAIPDVGGGVKAAIHHDGEIVDADSLDRAVAESDLRPVRDLASRFMPALGTTIRESAVCLYTNTPSRDFVIDRLPGASSVILVSACSGHGFKFSSAIGEFTADIVRGTSPSVSLDRFRYPSNG
jgi:sarcosine oxidase